MGKSKELAELGDVVTQSGGNVGIGGEPDAWDTFNVVQANNVSIAGYSTTQGGMIQNAYYNAGWKYSSTNPASMYYQDSGVHQFHTAASGTSGASLTWSERMRIDAAGRVTMPYQPSFMVRPSDDHTYSGVGFTTVSNWTSSAVGCHNVGGHMGATYFTAPVSGRYYFHASLLHDAGTVKNWVGYGYYVNNYLAVDVLGLNTGSYSYQRNTGSVILSLQAGDTVHIAIRDDGGDGWIYATGASATPYSWFTGYLIG